MAAFLLRVMAMRDIRLAIPLLFAPLLCAQQPDNETVFTSDARLVEVHATVAAPDGTLLTDLPQSAFRVYENGVEQEIKVFRREDAPVSLGLVVDNSASMSDKHARVAAALLTLVRASNPGDEEFVIYFSEVSKLQQDFTSDPAVLARTLNTFNPYGETALRDALSMGIAHLTRLAKNDRKALVVVTDGEDNSSSIDLERLTREAQQSGVLIYAIGLLNDSTEREAARARKDLDALTAATGGEAFYPKMLTEVDGIAKQVAHDLRNQYTIAYSPTDRKQDGTYRSIKVVVTNPPDTVVRTRSGYYANPPQVSQAAQP